MLISKSVVILARDKECRSDCEGENESRGVWEFNASQPSRPTVTGGTRFGMESTRTTRQCYGVFDGRIDALRFQDAPSDPSCRFFVLHCTLDVSRVCGPQSFRGRPERRSQEDQIFDQELACTAKYFNAVSKLDCAWRGKQEAGGEQKRCDGPQASDE